MNKKIESEFEQVVNISREAGMLRRALESIHEKATEFCRTSEVETVVQNMTYDVNRGLERLEKVLGKNRCGLRTE